MTNDTSHKYYADRLLQLEQVWWKRLLNPQMIYRNHLRRLNPGFTLDIGCGLGRNLLHIGGNGVGIDHSERAVQIARSRGLSAFTASDFDLSEWNKPAAFDTILFSHIFEHMTAEQAGQLISSYRHNLKPAGRLIAICPQEAGYASDPTHVNYLDLSALRTMAAAQKLDVIAEYSFPFPAFAGSFFKYNENISIWRALA